MPHGNPKQLASHPQEDTGNNNPLSFTYDTNSSSPTYSDSNTSPLYCEKWVRSVVAQQFTLHHHI